MRARSLSLIAIPVLAGIALWLAPKPARSNPQATATAAARPVQHGNAAEFMPPGKTKDAGCKMKGALPDPDCTPGAVMGLTPDEICSSKTGPRRNVTETTKQQVLKEYDLAIKQPHGAYEIDHFIPLELGGSNDVANLWPQPSAPTPGYHQKDKEENFLHEQVCTAKTMTLADAQRTIASDWLTYYNSKVPH